MMKNKLSEDEMNDIAPNKLFDMTRLVTEKRAYKKYLNYIIEHISL